MTKDEIKERKIVLNRGTPSNPRWVPFVEKLFDRKDGQGFNKYKKKPVVVDAIKIGVPFMVETRDGTMRGNADDWLIRGIAGELYPCKPDIFEKTYEPTEETARMIADRNKNRVG